MATRYWVGGTGTWNASNTGNWSASSGGASGASAPTSADDVVIDASSGGGTITIASGAACNNCTINWTAVKTNVITLSANFAPAGTLTINGNSAVNRILVQSSAIGTARTITAASVALSNCDFMDIAGAGAAAPFTGTSLGDCLGNSGITFTPAQTNYWRSTSGGTKYWADIANWASASGGTGGTGRVPLPQDTARFDASGVSAAGVTIWADMPREGKDIDFTGVTNTPSLYWATISDIYGSLTYSAGLSVAAGGEINFRGRSSHTITSAGAGFSGVNIYAYGGTYTMQDALSSPYGYMFRVFNGTLNTGGYSITTSSRLLLQTSQAAPAIIMGASTLTFTSTSTLCWYNNGAASQVQADTSTIKYTNATTGAKHFIGGGSTYNRVWFSGAGVGDFQITGSNTFADLKISDGAKTLKFTAGTTTTIASATGFEDNAATITSVTSATHTLVKSGGGTVSMRGANVSYSIASPAATFYAGATGTDGGNNTNWTFNNAPASATASITEANDSQAVTATVAVTGAASQTDADTLSATGTAAVAAVSAIADDADALASGGTVAVAGVAAQADESDAQAMAGAVAVSAAGLATDDADTLVAAGDVWTIAGDSRYVVALRRRNFTALET